MLDLRSEASRSKSNSNDRDNVSIPVTSQQSLVNLSPYLNFDPAYLPVSQPEYILPEGGTNQRGRFELAFCQIGAACIAGASLGGASGFYRGLRLTTLAGETGKVRITQVLNHVVKSGSSVANTLGTLTVFYSGFGVIISKIREKEDCFNTVGAATLTGLLFKSTAGIPKCASAGAVGLGLATAYCLFTNYT